MRAPISALPPETSAPPAPAAIAGVGLAQTPKMNPINVEATMLVAAKWRPMKPMK